MCNPRIVLLVILLPAILLQYHCASSQRSSQGQSIRSPSSKLELFSDAYRKIKQYYLYPVPPYRLASKAIEGMAERVDSPPIAASLREDATDEDAVKAVESSFDLFSRTGKVSTAVLDEAAVKGMTKALDRHTAFMTYEMYQEMQHSVKDQLGGIGLQLQAVEGQLTVVAPIGGSPADRAGLKLGDHLTEIGGQSTKNLTLMEAVQRLRGPVGQKVRLTVERRGEPTPIVFECEREHVLIHGLTSKVMNERIGYLQVTQFQERTSKELSDALIDFRSKGIGALILDLRNCPGGLLTTAVQIAEQFLPRGAFIVRVQGRTARDEYKARSSLDVWGERIVVLTNGSTAAGAEAVAGALQDDGRAIVIGSPTLGQGTVQTIVPLAHGTGLRLTTAEIFSPKGRPYDRTKIQPDILVRDQPGADAVLSVAVSTLTEYDKLRKDH